MKVKVEVVKNIKVNAGPYRTKSFRTAPQAAKFYVQWSNLNYIINCRKLNRTPDSIVKKDCIAESFLFLGI